MLARQAAIEQGAREAWFVDKDGAVTEGASANAWIVTPAGAVVTRHADHAILRGITRTVLFDAIKAQGLAIEERAFTLEEAYAAREAFVTSASQIVLAGGAHRRPHHRRRQAGPGRQRRCGGNFTAMRRRRKTYSVSGLTTFKSGKRLKSRSADHNSRTPCWRHSAAMRAS